MNLTCKNDLPCRYGPHGPEGEEQCRYCGRERVDWNRDLYRTPYFVLPRLAIEAMPIDWQQRFAALLEEAEEMRMKTPDYIVHRKDPPYPMRGIRIVNSNGFGAFVGRSNSPDPWANYRHGDVRKLCPEFEPK